MNDQPKPVPVPPLAPTPPARKSFLGHLKATVCVGALSGAVCGAVAGGLLGIIFSREATDVIFALVLNRAIAYGLLGVAFGVLIGTLAWIGDRLRK